MEQRKKSFVAGMQHTQGLARTASAMFFKQEKTETPITRRTIFWIQALIFIGYAAAALAIVIMFFRTDPTNPAFKVAYNTEQAPDVDWGLDDDGKPCGFGGCTRSPTRSPTS